MKHIHADLMAAYAADAQTTDRPWELWESHNTEVKIEWYTLKSDPSWNPSFEYRRKPKQHAIMLNEEQLKKILVACESHWVKLRGEAANSALVWEIVESITEVLENLGVDVEENWIGEECKLILTKKGEQQ